VTLRERRWRIQRFYLRLIKWSTTLINTRRNGEVMFTWLPLRDLGCRPWGNGDLGRPRTRWLEQFLWPRNGLNEPKLLRKIIIVSIIIIIIIIIEAWGLPRATSWRTVDRFPIAECILLVTTPWTAVSYTELPGR
jgi:hypothetical protein